jgi:hypothetical protein
MFPHKNAGTLKYFKTIITSNFFITEMQRIPGCLAVGWYCNVLGVIFFIYTAEENVRECAYKYRSC